MLILWPQNASPHVAYDERIGSESQLRTPRVARHTNRQLPSGDPCYHLSGYTKQERKYGPPLRVTSLIRFQTFISDNCVLAAGKYLLAEKKSSNAETSEGVIQTLAAVLTPESPIDTKRLALVVIRTVSRTNNDLITTTLPTLAPATFASVRSPIIPVKLAAEAAFLSIFSVVDRETEVFDEYMAGAGAGVNATTKRSIQDYFKRVAMRLGAQARERREAEGGQGGLGLSNDEREDEREIWSVGKVDLGEGAFGDE